MDRSYLVAQTSATGTTAEHFLIRELGLGPRSALKRAFAAREILVNGRPATRLTAVNPGDRVEVLSDALFAREEFSVRLDTESAAALSVLYEDDGLLVVDKPAGQSVAPLKPDETGTTLNAIAARFADAAAPMPAGKAGEGGLVHRLDRGTSGALVCARNAGVWAQLRSAWSSREVRKVYLTWVHGDFTLSGRLDCRLAHDEKSKKRMTPSPREEGSWRASTSFSPVTTARLAELRGHSYNKAPVTLVVIRIHTGVMHQIRATMAALGHPVLGDQLYEKAQGLITNAPLKSLPLEALDAATTKEFARLTAEIPPRAVPHVEKLPEGGFFLHALWLQSDTHPGLLPGIVAPVPSYFTGY